MTKTARAMLFAIAALVAAASHAHDSWFAREGDGLTLVTGTRFPKADLVPPPESFVRRECTGDGRARACWAELREFDIVLDDGVVDVYFREAKPDEAVRAQWQALHAARKAWHERYRKFARVEISDRETPPEQRALLRRPAGLVLELLPRSNAAFETGAPARFVLLSQGEPVRDQPVELVSERHPLGLWSRTDSRGEVAWRLPFGGAWLVRTVLIEPDGREAFRSRFATFAFHAS